MISLSFMVPVAILMGVLFVLAFIWMAKNGQYDDLDTPAHRILLEDRPPTQQKTKTEDFKNENERKTK